RADCISSANKPTATQPVRRFAIVANRIAHAGVVFLLLNPGHQAGVNHQLHASCDGPVNCWREFVPTSIRTLPATSIAFVRSRAGPLKSLVACCALLTPADGIGPPWLDQRWPPGACARPKTCRATGQASSSEERHSSLPPRNSLRSTGRQWVIGASREGQGSEAKDQQSEVALRPA